MRSGRIFAGGSLWVSQSLSSGLSEQTWAPRLEQNGPESSLPSTRLCSKRGQTFALAGAPVTSSVPTRTLDWRAGLEANTNGKCLRDLLGLNAPCSDPAPSPRPADVPADSSPPFPCFRVTWGDGVLANLHFLFSVSISHAPFEIYLY